MFKKIAIATIIGLIAPFSLAMAVETTTAAPSTATLKPAVKTTTIKLPAPTTLEQKIEKTKAAAEAKVEAVKARVENKNETVNAKGKVKINAVNVKAKGEIKIDAVKARVENRVETVNAKGEAKVENINAKAEKKTEKIENKIEERDAKILKNIKNSIDKILATIFREEQLAQRISERLALLVKDGKISAEVKTNVEKFLADGEKLLADARKGADEAFAVASSTKDTKWSMIVREVKKHYDPAMELVRKAHAKIVDAVSALKAGIPKVDKEIKATSTPKINKNER